MIIFWLCLGVLMASSVWFIYHKFHVAGKMSVTRWVLAGISILWGAFTLAWAVSSIAEGEMQAAGMGLLIFGAIFLCLVILTIKSTSLTKLTSKTKASNTKTV